MSSDYNGWTNRATWLVSLHIDNEESSYRYWRGEAKEWFAKATQEFESGKYASSLRVWAKGRLAAQLEYEFTTEKDALLKHAPTLWCDIVAGVIAEIDWHEIADNILSDVEEGS